MAKVSIIVPVYKVPEELLKKCINSCLNQTLTDIEIILVDDGSPDCCGRICDDYSNSDSRIKVIHKSNGGLAAARNTGFEAASADWIMFVDGDDWIDPQMCKKMFDVASTKHVDLVMCAFIRDYGTTSVPYKFYIEENKIYSGEGVNWLQEQLLHFNGNIAVAYCKLINRNFLVENRIEHDPELRQGAEGLEFNLRLFEVVKSAVFINKSFYHYTYNPSSISSLSTEDNNYYILKCFDRINSLILKSKNKDHLFPWFYNRLLYVIISSTISGYFNPYNSYSYKERKERFNTYLQTPLVRKALKENNVSELSRERRLVLFLINHRACLILYILGIIRVKQKNNTK